MAKTVQSRKQKGRILQQIIRDKILETFSELTERDVRSTPMGVSGVDIQLSQKAADLFPFSIESKNQEKLNIWNALKEAESDTKERDLMPLLIFKRNRSNIYCTFKFTDFLKIIKNGKNI